LGSVGRAGGLVARALGVLLEPLEEPIQVFAVEDQARALLHSHQLRAPQLVEGSPLDPDIRHGFAVGQASFHRTK
jgi:hypothetical protein